MRRTTMTGSVLMAVAVSAAGVARPARAGIAYTVTDLGTLPGFVNSFGDAVNASGQVAGFSATAGQALLSGPGGVPLQDLGTLPGGSSRPAVSARPTWMPKESKGTKNESSSATGEGH